MIDAKQIPDEVVEAAARAVCEAENGPCECLPDECGCTYWLAHARASIAAALNAWQTPEHKAFVGSALDDVYGFFPAIILPLPKGVSDE